MAQMVNEMETYIVATAASGGLEVTALKEVIIKPLTHHLKNTLLKIHGDDCSGACLAVRMGYNAGLIARLLGDRILWLHVTVAC